MQPLSILSSDLIFPAMLYQKYKEKLKRYFDKKNYAAIARTNAPHSREISVYTCTNHTEIYIVYPGYKALKNGKIVYDYRVDIRKHQCRTSLSHANIIVDIYNKCANNSVPLEMMKQFLVDMAQENRFDLKKYPLLGNYTSQSVDNALRERIRYAHVRAGKVYNMQGNSWDLTIEELLFSIFWIVIQEDINYPMPQYLGRKMPFSRYMEALHCIGNTAHKLEEVVIRALSHSRVPQWADMDYSFLGLIAVGL